MGRFPDAFYPFTDAWKHVTYTCMPYMPIQAWVQMRIRMKGGIAKAL